MSLVTKKKADSQEPVSFLPTFSFLAATSTAMDPDERFTPNPILSPRPRVQWCVCVSVCLVCSAPTVSLRRSYWLTDCKHENKGTCNHFNMEWSIPMVTEIIFVYNVTFFFNVSFFKEWGSPSPFVFFFLQMYWRDSKVLEVRDRGGGVTGQWVGFEPMPTLVCKNFNIEWSIPVVI